MILASVFMIKKLFLLSIVFLFSFALAASTDSTSDCPVITAGQSCSNVFDASKFPQTDYSQNIENSFMSELGSVCYSINNNFIDPQTYYLNYKDILAPKPGVYVRSLIIPNALSLFSQNQVSTLTFNLNLQDEIPYSYGDFIRVNSLGFNVYDGYGRIVDSSNSASDDVLKQFRDTNNFNVETPNSNYNVKIRHKSLNYNYYVVLKYQIDITSKANPLAKSKSYFISRTYAPFKEAWFPTDIKNVKNLWSDKTSVIAAITSVCDSNIFSENHATKSGSSYVVSPSQTARINYLHLPGESFFGDAALGVANALNQKITTENGGSTFVVKGDSIQIPASDGSVKSIGDSSSNPFYNGQISSSNPHATFLKPVGKFGYDFSSRSLDNSVSSNSEFYSVVDFSLVTARTKREDPLSPPGVQSVVTFTLGTVGTSYDYLDILGPSEIGNTPFKFNERQWGFVLGVGYFSKSLEIVKDGFTLDHPYLQIIGRVPLSKTGSFSDDFGSVPGAFLRNYGVNVFTIKGGTGFAGVSGLSGSKLTSELTYYGNPNGFDILTTTQTSFKLDFSYPAINFADNEILKHIVVSAILQYHGFADVNPNLVAGSSGGAKGANMNSQSVRLAGDYDILSDSSNRVTLIGGIDLGHYSTTTFQGNDPTSKFGVGEIFVGAVYSSPSDPNKEASFIYKRNTISKTDEVNLFVSPPLLASLGSSAGTGMSSGASTVWKGLSNFGNWVSNFFSTSPEIPSPSVPTLTLQTIPALSLSSWIFPQIGVSVRSLVSQAIIPSFSVAIPTGVIDPINKFEVIGANLGQDVTGKKQVVEFIELDSTDRSVRSVTDKNRIAKILQSNRSKLTRKQLFTGK